MEMALEEGVSLFLIFLPFFTNLVPHVLIKLTNYFLSSFCSSNDQLVILVNVVIELVPLL